MEASQQVPRTAVKIDPEFRTLIQPLAPDEYAGLEACIQSEGCREALVLWKGKDILVDGHNRYELCTRLGIEFTTREMQFDSRDDAIIWH